MNFNDRNFVSFMQTNYNTVRVSFLNIATASRASYAAAPAMPAPAMPATAQPVWANNERPWIVQEELEEKKHSVALYSYKVPKHLKLEVGDIIVVPSRDTIAFAKVEVVDEIPSLDFSADVTYKWIIGKVDFNEYNELVKAEAEFARKMENVQRMRVQQEAINTMRAQLLSDNDPVTATLFADALKTIGASVPTAPVQNPSANAESK